jgi:uncharacterized linocin/CFP29 family protein
MPEMLTNSETFFGGNPGAVQRLLANNCDMNVLRTNAILQQDEWKELDKRVVKVATERLIAVQDLISNGLVLNLGGIGVTMSQFQTESDMTGAVISMEPDSAGSRDNLDYQAANVPIPIIHKDFTIGLRQLEASRRMGSNIDMSTADAASRKVAEAMEDLVIKGSGAKFAGNSIYGYTNHPNRLTGSATGTWDDIDNIYDTVLAMLAAAETQKKYGPFNLYVAGDIGANLYRVYDDGSGQTVAQRLQNITPIKSVKVADRWPKGRVGLVQMDSGTVDLAVAQTLIPVEWTTNGGMTTQYKILTALAPRLKPDANGALGVVDFAGAGGVN